MRGRDLRGMIVGLVVGLTVPAAAQVPPPTIGGPFGPLCQEGVLSVRPTSVTVDAYPSPTGQAVSFDLELREYARPSGSGTLLDSITGHPQDAGGAGTALPLDDTVFLEDYRYELRLRQWDGAEASGWSACDFWIDTINSAPAALAILSPTSGTSFPSDTRSVAVIVQNASDAEAGIPGSSLSVALCASLSPDFRDCDASPVNWQLEPSVADPASTTEVLVTQLSDGRPLAPDLHVYVQACALDDRDEWGPLDDTAFFIEAVAGPCPGGCAAGEVCEDETGTCLAACPPPCPEGDYCDVGLCRPDPCVGVACAEDEACNRRTGACEQVFPCCSDNPDETGCGNCINASASGGRVDLAGLLLLGLLLGIRWRSRGR